VIREIISRMRKMKNRTLNPTHAIPAAAPNPRTPKMMDRMRNTIANHNIKSTSSGQQIHRLGATLFSGGQQQTTQNQQGANAMPRGLVSGQF
jgi:hypothetical protein